MQGTATESVGTQQSRGLRPRSRGLRRRPLLLAVAVAGPLLELALLWWLAPASMLPLAPQVTAPEPLGIFHDLRWLLVYHPSWAAFVVEAIAMLAFRSTVAAVLVSQAWPDEVERPPFARILAPVAVFTAITAALLSPWAAFAFGVGVMSLSWLFFVAIPVTLLVGVFMHHGVVRGPWWCQHPPLRTVGWALLSFVVLTAAGGLLVEVPAALRLPVVAATGLFNAWAWTGIVHGVVCHRPSLRVPLAPIGVAALVAVAAVGTVVGFRLGRPDGDAHAVPAGALDEGRPVLVVTGFGTGWDGRPQERFPGSFEERRFSYRGTARSGRAVGYEAEDTLRSISELVFRMRRQVEAFHAETGRQVSIVAESEGALLAKSYVTAYPDAPVDRLVLLSPLVRPARVYYPPQGQDGWGVVTSWELRGLSALIRGLTPMEVSTDTELFRSVADNAPVLRSVLACPAPGIDELAVVPVADAVASAELDVGGLRVLSVPAFHGGLLGNPDAQRLVALELAGREAQGSSAWTLGARAVRAMAATWQVPELPLSLNPAWDGVGDRGCASMGAALRAERDGKR